MMGIALKRWIAGVLAAGMMIALPGGVVYAGDEGGVPAESAPAVESAPGGEQDAAGGEQDAAGGGESGPSESAPAGESESEGASSVSGGEAPAAGEDASASSESAAASGGDAPAASESAPGEGDVDESGLAGEEEEEELLIGAAGDVVQPAASMADLQAAVAAYGTGGGSGTALTATVVDPTTLRVLGNVTGATSGLALDIPEGVTVKWNAKLTVASAAQSGAVTLTGGGTLQLEDAKI